MSPVGPYLVVHVADPNALVAKAKGSGMAWATNMLVPEFVTNQVYQTIADTLKTQLRENGSDATVDIVQTPPIGAKPSSDLAGGVVLGLLLAAIGFGAAKLL